MLPAADKLQKKVLQAAQPVINLVVKQAREARNTTLQEKRLSCSDILATGIESLVENGIASRGLAPVRESRKTAQGTMFVTRTWYLFRIIPWGTRQQPEVSNQDVIDRYALQPAILQKVWMDRVKQYSDNDGNCSKPGVQNLVMQETMRRPFQGELCETVAGHQDKQETCSGSTLSAFGVRECRYYRKHLQTKASLLTWSFR